MYIVFVKPNTRLFAVMWEITQELHASRKVEASDSCNAKFRKRDGKDSELALDTLLSTMAVPADRKCGLLLVFGETT